MITILRTSEHGLEIIERPTDGCWISLTEPTSEEIAQVRALLEVPDDFLTYALDLDERSRTEREDGALLIVLRIPILQAATEDIPYGVIPLGIVLSPEAIVTVCRYENSIVDKLISARTRNVTTHKPTRFVLQVLYTTAIQYLAYLREIDRTIDTLEDRLQASLRNRELLELLKYQKSLVYFATALRSNELMMERLQKSGLFRAFPEDEDLLDDVLTENQQAIEMVGISNNILSQMMDAFASIISNNLNVVMKFLASVTIVLSIPTLIASLYGMNVALPFANSPSAFYAVLALCAVLSLTLVAIFRRRDWF
ncbi:MAG: magnesium transporter CorA family protein [Chloroflexi bacterium]|nr:magnesium transporter CorA family protein [Chloroflexota bacterium]